MSVKRLSPTADLLRNSRLFALPRPLPRPQTTQPISAIQGPFVYSGSETATTHFPTHAAIETPEESLGRGDWGLKRSLPLKTTTRTSTPTIRIDNVDSADYITDFGSAADHVQTLRKWQELDLPMSAMNRERRASDYQPPPTSVFESDADKTAIDPDSSQERWKFAGPWLAGQDELEFETFLNGKVRNKRQAFREFLRLRIAKSRATTRRREAVESGKGVEETSTGTENEASKVADGEVDSLMKQLGQNQDTMQRVLEEFLDLPREHKTQISGLGRSSYNDKGPQRTHPSAGLSYLRTASHTFNHPLHGPQQDRTPTQGRVLRPQVVPRPKGGSTSKRQALVGVGGVITKDPQKPFSAGDDHKEVEMMIPDLEGGGKVWVHPKRAEIDVNGAIQLTYKRGERNAINVILKDRGDEPNAGLPAAAINSSTNRFVPDLAPSKSGGTMSAEPSGSGPKLSQRAKPFPPQSDIAGILEQALRGRNTS